MSEADEAPAAATVSAVSLKQPSFWASDPDVWFVQVEAQFNTRGITAQKTKYEYIVASLSPEFATQVCDLILRVPAITTYDTLKQQLILRTAVSEQRMLRQLVHYTELGDQRPTQLLQRMQQLLRDHSADAKDANGPLLRELFLQRLPANLRIILASSSTLHIILASSSTAKSLDQIAQQADEIINAAPPSASALTQAPPSSEIEDLRTEVSQLKEMVAALSSSGRLSRKRSPSPYRLP